jgi:sugar phosphate isomerase/epimerase
MARPVTMFTGQWADIPLSELAPIMVDFGYDGLELACWGDHMDVDKAAVDQGYCDEKRQLLDKHGLKCFSISHHLAGQLVCDPNNDARSDMFAPEAMHGDAEKKRAWAVETMKNAARAAKNMGVDVVNGFTGSSIWHMIYSFPPASEEMIASGFEYFAEMFNPIFDVFDECGVKFALEVHPTEIAFDIITAKRALAAVDNRETFGFNFDPSHFLWQQFDPVQFLTEFPDRIYHVHMKDVAIQLDGYTSILGSHLNFGHPQRGWDFRSVGRGQVDFEGIIRALNDLKYEGPLSVEWEDARMDRMHGAKESCDFVKNIDFPSSGHVFDEAFDK